MCCKFSISDEKKDPYVSCNRDAVLAGPSKGGLQLTEGPLGLQEEPQLLYHCLRSQIKWNSDLEAALLERVYQNKKVTVNGP